MRDLGLDDAMIDVYEYMADQRKADFGQIYDKTTLSRRGLSIALEALIAMGALKREGPYYVIDDLHRSLSAMAPARFEEIRAEIDSYRHTPRRVSSCPIVELASSDIAGVPSLIGREIESAINEIAVLSHTLAWLDDETMDVLNSAIQRGVRIRVLTYKHPDLASDARALRDVGVEVRCDEYARFAQFMIIDSEFVCYDVPVPPGGQKYLGLRIRDADTCRRMLAEVFEPAWKDAKS